jgi:hypothetical protein
MSMNRARVRRPLVTVVLLIGTPAAAQAPHLRVQFRLADSVYVQAFTAAERDSLEDSATAMLVRQFSRHLGFLSFTRNPADSSRVLRVILDQKEPGSGSRLGERGLHLLLKNPPFEPRRLYWRTFRTIGFAARDTVGSVTTFLGELGIVLDNLDGTAWDALVSGLLSSVSIADTSAAAWVAPPGSGSPVDWLIPLRPDSACFDPDRSRLRIRNDVYQTGNKQNLVATARPLGTLSESRSFVVPTALERYRGQIRAPLDSPITVFSTPPGPDSIRVKAVFVTAYGFDILGCASLAPIARGP